MMYIIINENVVLWCFTAWLNINNQSLRPYGVVVVFVSLLIAVESREYEVCP